MTRGVFLRSAEVDRFEDNQNDNYRIGYRGIISQYFQYFVVALIPLLFISLIIFNSTAGEAKGETINQKPLAIILSPHFDDAILSLGGFLAAGPYRFEAVTIFGGKPAKPMVTYWDQLSGFKNSTEAVTKRIKENARAIETSGAVIKNYDYLDSQYRQGQNQGLETAIIKTIKSLIPDSATERVSIYGPATFGPKITHPDHQLLHDAFLKVAKENKQSNLHFFIYEDFPYISEFNHSNRSSLFNYLILRDRIRLRAVPIEFPLTQLNKKISAINDYTSQVSGFRSRGNNISRLADVFNRRRCRSIKPSWPACEMVYEIIK